MENEIPFESLTPVTILQAIDSLGFFTSGSLLALNSYENRVYQVGLEEGEQPIIAKFYRPGRWSKGAILEEHEFSRQLFENDISVVPPLLINNNTLHEFNGYRFALYERKPGRAPDVSIDSDLEQMGRLLARIHLVGRSFPFVYREKLDVHSRGYLAQEFILKNRFLPDYLALSYENLTMQLLELCERQFNFYQDIRFQSIHGDFHLGNILSDGERFFIVDLDDAVSGPCVQDLWMLLSGEHDERQYQLNKILKGYLQFKDFDPVELHLLEVLKTLRIIHYSGWLAKRWHDPAFPYAFPWFNTARYWEEHINSLQEQLFNMQNTDELLAVV